MASLRQRLEQIERELTDGRDPGDTHDYSSSRYNGFDDGYINAVEETIERVTDLLKAENLLDERVSSGPSELPNDPT